MSNKPADSLEQYLKTHPSYKLTRQDFKIRYTTGIENVEMCLFWLKNNYWTKGIWRVCRIDGQICQYHGEDFNEALKIFERGEE